MAHSVIPNFIIKSTKYGFLMMFRNGTGHIYIVPKLTAALHNDPVNELPKTGIKPHYIASLNKQTGRFQIDLADNHSLEGVGKTRETCMSRDILNMINKEDTAFLNEGFLSPELLVGLQLSKVDRLAKGCKALEDLTEGQKASLASSMVLNEIITSDEELAKESGFIYNSNSARQRLMSRFSKSTDKTLEAASTVKTVK